MTTELNQKIVDILKKHPEGGESFFDALDLMIRSDRNILQDFLGWVHNNWAEDFGVILTGRFGMALVSNCLHELHKYFPDVLIVNGGIRQGQEVEILKTRDQFKCRMYAVLDDSYYSGTTFRKIENAVETLTEGNVRVPSVYVIYDGSKSCENSPVYAMYRYYSK